MLIPVRFCEQGIEAYKRNIEPRSATKEHVTPRAHGGADEEDNLVASCGRCNVLRGSCTWELFSLITAKILADEDIREAWHTTDPLMFRLVRKIVRLEITLAKAFVSKEAAFETAEKHPSYEYLRTAV